MKRMTLLSSWFFLVACQPGGLQRSEVPADSVIVATMAKADIHPEENYYLGQVQIEFQEGVDAAKFAQNHSLSVLDRIYGQNIYLFEVKTSQKVDALVSQLSKQKGVTAVSKNYHMSSAGFHTNDPHLSKQWALLNKGQEAPHALGGMPGADIEMNLKLTEGSKNVVVAVIDTGIDYLHEDLADVEMVDGKPVVLPSSNIWINQDEIPGDGIDNDNNGYIDDVYGYNFVDHHGDPMDDHGHGTHCSGVIGAKRDNRTGIVGINAKVSIMGLKFLGLSGGSDFDAQKALYYVLEMKNRHPEKRFVTSNSWGMAGRNTENGDESDMLLRAFAKTARANILHIAAAGNDSMSTRFAEFYPANYSRVLDGFVSVAASNNMDQLAGFSNFGYGKVQVAAPGVLIHSTLPKALYPEGYAAWSGTSMAAPHVAGLAALLWANHPEMTAIEVQERIQNTVDIKPQYHGLVSTNGRINIRRALENDVNVAMEAVAVMENLDYVTASPPSKASYENLTTISPETVVGLEGAKEITICFNRLSLQADYDWLEVLGADYRIKDVISAYRVGEHSLTEEKIELCTAPVLGDTVHLRFYHSGSTIDDQGYETSHLKVVK